jgi:hypothetical protein
MECLLETSVVLKTHTQLIHKMHAPIYIFDNLIIHKPYDMLKHIYTLNNVDIEKRQYHRLKETTVKTNNLLQKRDTDLIDLLVDYIEELLYL